MFCLRLSLHQNVGSEVGGNLPLYLLLLPPLPLAWSDLRPLSTDAQRHAKLHLVKDALRVNTELLSVCSGPTRMNKVFFLRILFFFVSFKVNTFLVLISLLQPPFYSEDKKCPCFSG